MDDGAKISVRFITRKWPPAVGGMETYSARLVESLRRFAEVDITALPGREDGSPPNTPALLRFGLVAALRLLLASPRQVTHIGDMASWPFALVARFRSKRTRIALSAHGTDVSFSLRDGAAARLYDLYLKVGAWLLPSAVVIANSTATAEAAKRFGFKHVAVVPLATDIQGTVPAEPHNGNLLFVGRLTPRKGCAWFIRNVLPLLPVEMSLRVAGTKRDEDEWVALNNPRVTFLGSVHGDALVREYRSALCVIVPTLDFEGFGLAAVEATASGGLVLASRHSGLTESVIDGVTGFHVRPGDAAAWARKIRDIGNWRNDQRASFIAKAIASARQHYTWDRVAQDTLIAYLRPPLDVSLMNSGGTNDELTAQ